MSDFDAWVLNDYSELSRYKWEDDMACKCVVCDYCNGSGHVWETESGHVSRYRCDDMGDLVECPSCDGRAIVEVCDECIDAEMAEQDEL